MLGKVNRKCNEYMDEESIYEVFKSICINIKVYSGYEYKTKEFKKNEKVRKGAKAYGRYVGLIRFHIRIERIKKRRASGGCLGNERRRRT